VMVPNRHGNEELHPNRLLVDLVHRAVRDIYETTDGKKLGIKVINVSLGDTKRPFGRVLSPWARLLDWLSWKYRTLFCVSAGNFSGNIDLGISDGDFKKLNDKEKSEITMDAMAKSLLDRRLLSPAESMNAITVGALHHDSVQQFAPKARIDIQSDNSLPSPVSRLGAGFRNGIKPDILMPGGRQLYRNYTGQTSAFELWNHGDAPGQSVAAPSAGTGRTDGTTYICGTSGATALASRAAAQIHEALQEIKSGNPDATLDDAYLAVLMKSLLVHGAVWGDAFDKIKSLKTPANSRTLKRYASRFLGYGAVDIERVLECTALRATVIGAASIKADEELEYRFPLPPALSGLAMNKRLIITLAWFTPTNPAHQNWRRAKLFFTPPKENGYNALSRKDADWRHVKKGTVQHEVLQGKDASAYQDGDYLRIPVVCKADAGELDDSIPFGIAVTLDVLDDINIDIYNEIRDRVMAQVKVAP